MNKDRSWLRTIYPYSFVGLFLDGLSPQVQKAAQEPVLYIEAMAAEDDDLLAGVTVDNEE